MVLKEPICPYFNHVKSTKSYKLLKTQIVEVFFGIYSQHVND